MGLQTWPNDEIRKSDSLVAKNYLGEHELRELNRLTVILLDIFEDQLDLGHLTTMSEIDQLLRAQLKQLKRPLLAGGGSVTTEAAKKHAHTQYEIFNEKRKAARHAQADSAIAELRSKEKQIPRARRSKPDET